MIRYLFFILGFFISGQIQSQSQLQERFVFRELDRSLIQMWLSDTQKNLSLDAVNDTLQSQWQSIREIIASNPIEHFDIPSFIQDQDRRILEVDKYIMRNDLKKARKESYVLLMDFKDVRACFTGDEYSLDSMLDAYEAYQSVHNIIHDQMMGLYEWTEFIWYVDQLKCKVESLETVLTSLETPNKNHALFAALDRVNTCLESLDNSLGDAYRPDFEIPCNDLKIAFTDLFLAYREQLNLSNSQIDG